ncbi:HypC/HybG/HupF family hydrogenase formation chaperone [Merdibacter massiliensis]|uniref:HypC/HybG/HupF family hydrogenase formation chaperone n=1 Tax=Merdibacter massiliensis TaxID=1871030 RepID=UPI00096A963C|nr:HypC/HybG/HupF family hydrogenase formation chaperone [Merdibacter massiliensis]
MCLAIPLKITEIHEKTAVGEAGGLSQSFRIDFLPNAKIGDHVMVHAGFAIEIIDPIEAEKTQQLYEEIFHAVSN